MSFILETIYLDDDFEEINRCYQIYYAYIESIKDKLPENVYRFAVADWHYDHEVHRCPHDGWIEAFLIKENATGKRKERRWLDIEVRILNAFHDGHIEITYNNVASYHLNKLSNEKFLNPDIINDGHGDWLIDEIRLSDKGYVIHEIIFRRNSRWLIECEDIVYKWKPLNK
jgi:hypothetical protein